MCTFISGMRALNAMHSASLAFKLAADSATRRLASGSYGSNVGSAQQSLPNTTAVRETTGAPFTPSVTVVRWATNGAITPTSINQSVYRVPLTVLQEVLCHGVDGGPSVAPGGLGEEGRDAGVDLLPGLQSIPERKKQSDGGVECTQASAVQ